MSKQALNDEDRREVVLYRIEKAKTTYREALATIKLNFVNAGANRLYYSAYYAVSALLLAYGITARTHSGIRDMLGLHFIKPELLEKTYGQLFARLFSLRMTGDYEDRRNLDMDFDVLPLVEPTGKFIAVITRMAKEKISQAT